MHWKYTGNKRHGKEQKKKSFDSKIYSRRLLLQYFIIQQQKTVGNKLVKSIEKHHDGKKKSI